MKSRRAFLGALLPAGVAAGQEAQDAPEMAPPILKHNLQLALTFGDPGMVRAEIQAPGMRLINLWAPETGLGLGSYRFEIKNSADGQHFILLLQVDAAHVNLLKVVTVGEDKKLAIPVNLQDGSWLIPKGLPDFLDQCDMRLWYRAPTNETARRLAAKYKVALDTFVGDWYRLPKWPRPGSGIVQPGKADPAPEVRRKGMFGKPDDVNVARELLDLDFETKTELKLVRYPDRTSAFLGNEAIFSHPRGSEFIHSGTIGSKRKSAALIMMSKSKDGYGGYYHSTIFARVTDKGDWAVETLLEKKKIEKLGIISVSEIAGISSSGERAFAKILRSQIHEGKRLGFSTWCVIDVRTGRIIHDCSPDDWASQ